MTTITGLRPSRQPDGLPGALTAFPFYQVWWEFEPNKWCVNEDVTHSDEDAMHQWVAHREDDHRAYVVCVRLYGDIPPQNVTSRIEDLFWGWLRSKSAEAPEWLRTQAQIDQAEEETRDWDRHIAAERADYRRVSV